MQKNVHLRKTVICAVMIAMQIILSRYVGIQTQFVQTSLGFVPIAVTSAVCGPVYGALCAFISDFLGVVIAGTNVYSPLFAINAVLYALFYAFFLYKKERNVKNIVLSVVLQTVIVAIPLTPLWLYIYFNFVLETPKAFELMSLQQVVVRLIEIPIKIIILVPVCRYLLPKLEKNILH